MGDTLAFRSDEGRGYRRNASGSWKQAKIRRCPNEATQKLLFEYINKKEKTKIKKNKTRDIQNAYKKR